MSWSIRFQGKRAAVRAAVAMATGTGELDIAHLEEVKPLIFAVLDANTVPEHPGSGVVLTASGHRYIHSGEAIDSFGITLTTDYGYIG